ncbi:hypothetical protein GGS21DRAFT_521591 [Xylaria nigripes]|nr:hypothetical protein GGS21DRAFT_521591 [Xylaria nigripes]
MRFSTALACATSAGIAAASTSGEYSAGASISFGYEQQPIGGIGIPAHPVPRDPALESVLRGLLGHRFTNNVFIEAAINYYTTVIHETTTLIEIINQAGCDKPKPGPGPGPIEPVRPDTPWYNCDARTPCKWLDLQMVESVLAAAPDQAALPHPNAMYIPKADYKYPFDTWVTASSGALQVFVDGKKVKEQGDGSFLIPGGTSASAVKYKSPGGAKVQFSAACSKDTPRLGRELIDWNAAYTYATKRDAVIDIGGYDYDVILTIADTSKTTEQFTVLVDGKEIDKTHGPLTLGDAKYDPANIPMIWVAEGKLGALESITHGGFWGSFRIPAGTEKATVHLEHFEAGWPDYRFSYRLDKLYQC